MARNHAALNWALELLPTLVEDMRLQVVFSLPTTSMSAWTHGVADSITRAGGIAIPWEQAISERFDLAIAANPLGDLAALRSPLLLLTHGPGFTRVVGLPPRGEVPIPRLDPSDDRAATTLVLTHPSQAQQFAPGAYDVFVGGDPCWDELVAGQAQRHIYRRALSVDHDQRLVVISSTWGGQSLLGAHPEALEDIVGMLPADSYRVALVLHPNIWAGHSEWQLRAWLGPARRAGLRVVPPEHGWRATIVASDVVIGDHGSVTFYAAMLGRPVMLGAFGTSELVPGTTTDLLGRVAPRVNGGSLTREQIDEVSPLEPHVRDPIRDAAFAFQGHSLHRHHDLLYRLIDLPGPHRAVAPRPPTIPDARWAEPSAWLVETEARSTEPVRIRVERFAPGLGTTRRVGSRRSHLAVVDGTDAMHLLESAGVIMTSPAQAPIGTTNGLRSIAARWPGSRVVAVPDGPNHWRILTRDGCDVAAGWDSSTDLHDAPASAIPSAVYALSLTEHWGPTSAPVIIEIEIAGRVMALRVTVTRAD